MIEVDKETLKRYLTMRYQRTIGSKYNFDQWLNTVIYILVDDNKNRVLDNKVFRDIVTGLGYWLEFEAKKVPTEVETKTISSF